VSSHALVLEPTTNIPLSNMASLRVTNIAEKVTNIMRVTDFTRKVIK
jgi:hypothetical protein